MSKYIINLDPANGTYLVASRVHTEGILSPLPSVWVTESTSDRKMAKRFSTYEQARAVTDLLRGWGGGEVIEEVNDLSDKSLPKFERTLEDGTLVWVSFWTRRSRLMGDRFLEVWAAIHGLRGAGSYSFCTAMQEEDIVSICQNEIKNLQRLGHLPN